MAPRRQDSKLIDPDVVITEVHPGILPLLTTKLYRPPITPDLENRQSLIEHLERNRQRPLTLISAPPGYGKTMLACLWLATSGCPCAWVTLDEEDNDLGIFLSYLLAAISRTFPGLGLKTQSLFNSPYPLDAQVLARYLLNDLDQISEPFILALDDTHKITAQSVYVLLDELLQHPPHSLHLVLIGRYDPPLQLTLLRARSQVTEIRTHELRFTTQETASLLGHILNREIDTAIAAEWTRSTEGWVTALRLAALSLRYRGQEEDLSLRIRGDIHYLRDFLLTEVLAHLTKDYQDWLIKSAILERFCAPLCEAVCQTDQGQSSLSGGGFIQWLEGENLFLIPLDDQYEWFRFHHLFQEMLLYLLSASSSSEEIADLRMRASQWFSENKLFDEALKYALAAGCLQDAIHLVEQNRYQLINAERWNQLSHWIGLFPDDVIDNDPILAITKAYLPSSYGQEEARMRSLAKQLVADLPSDSPVAREVKGEITYKDMLWSVLTGPSTLAIKQANDALALLPQRAEYFRVSAIGLKALGLQMSGNYKRGISLINETLNKSEWSAISRTKLFAVQSYIFLFEGDLITAQLWASESLKIASKIQLWHSISEAHYLSGIVHYLRNEIDIAEVHLSFLVDNRLFCDPIFVTQGACILTRIYHTQRQHEKASEVFSLALSQFEEIQNTYSLDILRAFQVELALDQDDLGLARRLYQAVNRSFEPPVWYYYIFQLTPVKLWLAEGSAKSLEKALATIERLNQQVLSLNRRPQYIEILALQSLVYQARGEQQKADESLNAALRLGEPGGFIRCFVDLGAPMANLLQRFSEQQAGDTHAGYIQQILAVFPNSQPSQAAATQVQLDEPLTQREMEVLSLLAQRLSNKEIAAKLVISPRTVKRHTLNIYHKLAVNRRQAAVEKASALGILIMDVNSPSYR